MYLECTCTGIGLEEWRHLMKGARKASYKRLVSRIKKEIPELYKSLCLDLYNPYSEQCQQTMKGDASIITDENILFINKTLNNYGQRFKRIVYSRGLC